MIDAAHGARRQIGQMMPPEERLDDLLQIASELEDIADEPEVWATSLEDAYENLSAKEAEHIRELKQIYGESEMLKGIVGRTSRAKDRIIEKMEKEQQDFTETQEEKDAMERMELEEKQDEKLESDDSHWEFDELVLD